MIELDVPGHAAAAASCPVQSRRCKENSIDARPDRTLPWPGVPTRLFSRREWIVTNGLGGYASGTVAGLITRRFHGLLIAALPSPFGRWMMLNDLTEHSRFADGRVIQLGGEDRVDPRCRAAADYLREFRLECGLPVWVYEVDGITSRSAFSCRTARTPSHLNYACSTGIGHRAARLASVHELPSPRRRAEDSCSTNRIAAGRSATGMSSRARNPQLPPLRMLVFGEERRSRSTGSYTANCCTTPRKAAAMKLAATCGALATFTCSSAAGKPATW